ncbi:hypothetical protein ACFOD7_14490 [Paracoccus fontiphilus]|uniref:Uncharacterized protein n=2 Tax=Paracoccus fontiphilus TaxID=1815556 RepID=A0ABV7IF88_9RHOB
MRCDACKFWQQPDGDEWEPVRQSFGRCARTPHVEDMTQWADKDGLYQRVMNDEHSDRTAAAADASGYAAWLLTKAEHFCPMFYAAAAHPQPNDAPSKDEAQQ